MNTIKEIVESGVLELYVIGDLSDQKLIQIEQQISESKVLQKEVRAIEKAFEEYAFANTIEPDATFKPMQLAVTNYTTRLTYGEVPVDPPSLHAGSKVSDYKEWLDKTNMQEPDEYDSMHGKIIGSNEAKTTMIIWLKEGAPEEMHTDELEKFLIVEGTCDIKIGNQVHSLKAGDYLSIPLYINHTVTVTSSKRCKIILERAAA